MGTSCSRRMVHRTSPPCILMLPHLDHQHKMQANSRHTHLVPHNSTHATISALDIIASATHDILHALQHPTNGSLLAPTTETETETLKQLATLLHNKTTKPTIKIKPEPTNTDNTPTVLRVDLKQASTDLLAPTYTTYHQTSKPKKHTNKHKQNRSKLAACNKDAVLNAANYTIQQLKNNDTNTHYCFSAIHPDMGLPAKYQHLQTSSEGAEWIIKTADEIGWLAQGNKDMQVQGTNTMFFIKKDIPNEHKPTYLCILEADWANKECTKRI